MLYNRLRSFLTITAVLAAFVVVSAHTAFAQGGDEKTAVLGDKVSGLDERTTTLETSVAGLQRLKISGYIQPQWVWNDVDSQANQFATHNFFQIRRGRIKFQHSTGNVSYLLYPDITENGVVLKEIIAAWRPVSIFEIALGAMNRPFGYEIAYSSSAREVAERSQAENRLFNGERDLGLQFALSPTINGFTPLLEVGLFNGSDNFGKGPVGATPGANNQLNFTSSQLIGGITTATPKTAADTLLNKAITSGLASDAFLYAGGANAASNGWAVNQKELLGHVRLPFLLSDAFSFDVGGSWSVGGIAEPTNVIGKYTGTSGALVLDASGTQSGTDNTTVWNGKTHPVSGIFLTNRSIFGADAQFYLSVLPIGGTIVKAELYSGQQPFYGSSALFSHSDSAALGAPRASTVYKKVLGYYAMLVQNIFDNLQIAVRYDVFDPNTQVTGTNFASGAAGSASTLRGVSASTGFGGDLQLSTLSVSVNVFISGAMRLMFDFDIPKTEDFTRVDAASKSVQLVSDAHDNRFTFRMQYKF